MKFSLRTISMYSAANMNIHTKTICCKGCVVFTEAAFSPCRVHKLSELVHPLLIFLLYFFSGSWVPMAIPHSDLLSYILITSWYANVYSKLVMWWYKVSLSNRKMLTKGVTFWLTCILIQMRTCMYVLSVYNKEKFREGELFFHQKWHVSPPKTTVRGSPSLGDKSWEIRLLSMVEIWLWH